jgi:predicted MFS family arabinose efflux permease
MGCVVSSSLIWLALGAFAIGTEGFMISGILPGMARDLGVSVAFAGQLVTIFAFAYAIGSPLIAVATATVPRRALLVGAMGAFTLANLLAAWAPDYGTLAFARVLLALSAGTFMPASGAYASMTVAPENRGRALAFIYSGMTIALVLGVPLGTLLAARLDWRATFLGVAILGALAVAGIVVKLKPAPIPPAIGLSRRLAVARRPDVLGILLLTVMVVTGAFLVNTYFGAFLETVFNVSPAGVAFFLFAAGVAAAGGNALGGYAADHWNQLRFLLLAITIAMVSFAMISVLAVFAPTSWALAGVGIAIVVWALFGWSVPSVQQTRLLSVDPHLAPITLSLNSSATYLAAALGAGLGSATIHFGSLTMIGAVSALCELVAIGFLFVTTRGRAVACPI